MRSLRIATGVARTHTHTQTYQKKNWIKRVVGTLLLTRRQVVWIHERDRKRVKVEKVRRSTCARPPRWDSEDLLFDRKCIRGRVFSRAQINSTHIHSRCCARKSGRFIAIGPFPHAASAWDKRSARKTLCKSFIWFYIGCDRITRTHMDSGQSTLFLSSL